MKVCATCAGVLGTRHKARRVGGRVGVGDAARGKEKERDRRKPHTKTTHTQNIQFTFFLFFFHLFLYKGRDFGITRSEGVCCCLQRPPQGELGLETCSR